MLCNSPHSQEERLSAYCHLLAKIIVERLTALTSSFDSSSIGSSHEQLPETTEDAIIKMSNVLLSSYNAGVECVVNERLSNSNYSQLRNYLTRSILPCVTFNLNDDLKQENFPSTFENKEGTTHSSDNGNRSSYNNYNKQDSIFAAPRSGHQHYQHQHHNHHHHVNKNNTNVNIAHSPNAAKKRTITVSDSTTHSLQELTDVLKCAPFMFFDCVDHVEFMYICTELDMTRPFVPSCIIAGMNKNVSTLSDLIATDSAFYSFAVECALHSTTGTKPPLAQDQIARSSKHNNTVNRYNTQFTEEYNVNTKNKKSSLLELETAFREWVKCALEVIIDTDARCKTESRFAAFPSLPVFSLHEEDKMLQRIFNAAEAQTNTNVNNSSVDADELSLCQKDTLKQNKEYKHKENKLRQTITTPPSRLELPSTMEEDESVRTVRNTGVFTMQEIVHFFKLQPHQAHKHLYECPRCHLSFLRRTDATTLECLRCRYNAEFELLHHPLRSQHAQLYQWSYIVYLIDHFDIAESVDCIAAMLSNHDDEFITISEHGKRAKVESIMYILVQCANTKSSNSCNAKVNHSKFSKTSSGVTTSESTIDVIKECLEEGVRVFVEHLPEHDINLLQLQSGAARRISAIPRIVNINGKKQISMSDTKSYEPLCKLLCVNAYVVWMERLRRHVKNNITAYYKKYVHSNTLAEYNTVPLMFIIYALFNAINVIGNEHTRQLLSYHKLNNSNNINLLHKIATELVKLVFIDKIIEESTRNRQVLKKEQKEQHLSKSNASNSSSLSVSSSHSFASSVLESLEQNNDAERMQDSENIVNNNNIITNSGSRESNESINDHVYYVNDYEGNSVNNEYNWHSYLRESYYENGSNDVPDISSNCVLPQQATSPMQIPLTLNNLHTMQRQQRRQEKKEVSKHKRTRNELSDINCIPNFKQEDQWKQNLQENERYRHKTERIRQMEITSDSRFHSYHSSLPSSSSSQASHALSSVSSTYSSSYSYDASASLSYSYVSSENNAHSRASSFSLRSYYANSNNNNKSTHMKELGTTKRKRNNRKKKYDLEEETESDLKNYNDHVRNDVNMEADVNASVNRRELNNSRELRQQQEEWEEQKGKNRKGEENFAANDNSDTDKIVEKVLALYYIAFCEVFGTVSVAHAKHYLAQMSSSQLDKDRPHSSSYSSSSSTTNSTTTTASASHLPTPAPHLWMPHLQRCTQGGMTFVELITEFVRRVKELTQCVRLIQD